MARLKFMIFHIYTFCVDHGTMTFPLIYPMDYVPKFKSCYDFHRFIISLKMKNSGKIKSLSLELTS